MNLKRLHFYSGLILTIFIGAHLFNHLSSLIGIETHLELMASFRKWYRNPVAETILILAVFFQISTGIQLAIKQRVTTMGFFEKLQVYSGLYMSFFLIIHVSAVFAGRIFMDLDTNFYFGAAGLNSFPVNLFFIPYYSIAILAFFGHIASIHYRKISTPSRADNNRFSSKLQAYIILCIGIIFTGLILIGMTDGFEGVNIPVEYHILQGK